MTIINNSKEDFIKLIKKKKFKKIFIITGKNSFYKSGIAKILNLQTINKKIYFFFKKSYLPEFEELKRITIRLNNFKPDLILAIGGGCVLDYAKIVKIIDLKNLDQLEKKLLRYETPGNKKNYPLVAIPTTAGSGAEVTSNAVIYINKIKYSVESNLLLPEYYFLIPKLIINNPLKLKSASGFDAIAQSIESLISIKSNIKSVNFAKKSLILSSSNYLNFLEKPNSINSKNMIIAANLAGQAINISKTTAPHAVSYPFTSMYGISHGHAVSLTFEKFLNFNYINMNKSNSHFDLSSRYKILFNVFKVKNINEFTDKIKYIKKRAKLEDRYDKLGLNIINSVDKILDGINILRLKNNPIKLSKKDIKNIIL